MNESAAKEQIAYTIIDVLLCLKPQDKARQQIFQILSGGKYNTATARCMIKDVLNDNGHKVDHERIQSCIDTVQNLTAGFRHWLQGRDEMSQWAFPARELARDYPRAEPIDWIERWQSCGGKIYSDGRMIAPTDDSIWLKISDFGLPFPPFAFNSGMNWIEIPRKEVIALGIIDPSEPAHFTSSREKYDLEVLQQLKAALESGEAKFRVKVEIVKAEQPHEKIPKTRDEQTD
jgi:hypothetical protein